MRREFQRPGSPGDEPPYEERDAYDRRANQPEEDFDGNAEAPLEPEVSRGCSWTLILGLGVILGVLVAAVYLIHSITGQGMVRQAQQTFQDVSLMPAPRETSEKTDMQIQLFYIVRGQALAAETRRLPKAASGVERLHLIAQELTASPASGLFQSPLPQGTTVRGLYVVNGIVWVDLSREFLQVKTPSPLAERLVVYALVNSFMLNDSTLQGVQLLVDGKPIQSAWGWLDLSTPLSQNLSLIR